MERPAPRFRRPSLDDVWTALAVTLPVIASLATRMRMVDLAYQLRAGQGVLDGGGIPRVDAFTFTVFGQRWLDQQWGAQTLLALVHHGGFAADAAFRAIVIGAVFGLILLACRARGASPRGAALLTLAGFAIGLDSLALRPQLLGALLFAGALWLLAVRGRHPVWTWALPALAVVWANVHGSFVLVPVLPTLAWLEDRIAGRPRTNTVLVVAAASALATFANPWGPGVWTYASDVATDPAIRRLVTEWAPTTPTDWGGVAFWASAVGAGAWVAWRARRGGREVWSLVPWLVTFAVLAVPAARGVLWWALAAPVALAPLAAGERSTRSDRRPNVVILAAVGALAVALLPWWRDDASLLRDAPTGLSDAVRSGFPAGSRLVTPQRWASWFELSAPPMPVMVDSRIELFSDAVWDDFLAIQRGDDGTLDLLATYGVEIVVVDRTQGELRSTLEAAGWRVVAEDPEGAVLGAPADR